MNRLALSLACGLLIVAVFGFTVWAQAVKTVTGQFQPFVIDIAQSVPVQVSVPLSGTTATTMTLPLTVSVNLQVKVDTVSRIVTVEVLSAPTPVVSVVQAGQEQTDDLGLTYELIFDSDELEIIEWTVYENPLGRLAISGVIALAADADPVDEIRTKVRAYRAGKIVEVGGIQDVGFRLAPGDTNRFDGAINVEPSNMDSYIVEFEIMRY